MHYRPKRLTPPSIKSAGGFTGKKEDAAGRTQCYQQGEHVACSQAEASVQPNPSGGGPVVAETPTTTPSGVVRALQQRAEQVKFTEQYQTGTPDAGEVYNAWQQVWPEGDIWRYKFRTAQKTNYTMTAYAPGVGEWTGKIQGVRETRFADQEDREDVTGAGGAHEVIGTVTAALAAFLRRGQPRAVEFVAREESRQKLYDRLAKYVASLDTSYSVLTVTANYRGKKSVRARWYYVVKREDRDEFLNQIQQQVGKRQKWTPTVEMLVKRLPK